MFLLQRFEYPVMYVAIDTIDRMLSPLPEQCPYNEHTPTEQPAMNQVEQDFHNSFKPSWGPGDVLVHASADGTVPRPPARLNQSMNLITNFTSEHREIRLSKPATAKDVSMLSRFCCTAI